MLRAYKYRLYPNKAQREIFLHHFGCCRFVYNWALNRKIKTYETTGKSISRFTLNNELVNLKNEYPWLKEVNSQSLQGSTLNLENAFTRFFREKKGFPNPKSKKNPVQSFSVPQNHKVFFETNHVRIPKVGMVKAKLHRCFEGKMKTATVSRNSTGKYFISILVDDGKELPEREKFDMNTTVGIDLGIKTFAVCSNGNSIENPKYLKNSLDRLKILQRRMSRKQKGSNNRRKLQCKIAKLHEKISNQRNDFQHKHSFTLISENQAIALETLNISGMLKNHKLAQHIADASWSSFVTKLEYKAEWYGKTILRIGQFEPSTKICNVCGYYNGDITLKDREWICPDCGTQHDRDINAAINIKKFALDKQNLIGT